MCFQQHLNTKYGKKIISQLIFLRSVKEELFNLLFKTINNSKKKNFDDCKVFLNYLFLFL